ncbi:hypothetical protein HDU67_010327, partial [Dinochytrium kinnereticum]
YKQQNRDSSIPPPPPPKGSRFHSGGYSAGLRPEDRKSIEDRTRNLKIAKEIFFKSGQFPLSDTNELIFVRHELNGGLPVNPQDWGFYSVTRHVEEGLPIHEKAHPKFQKEYKSLLKAKDDAAKHQSALVAIFDHSKLEYKRLLRQYTLAFKQAISKLESASGHKNPETDNPASNVQEETDVSTSKKRHSANPVREIEPTRVTESFVEEAELLDDSTILPTTLVFLKKDITRASARTFGQVLQTRLRAFLDTQNIGIAPKLPIDQLATRLNELLPCSPYLYRGTRNFVSSTRNPLSALPKLEELDDDSLRNLGVTYYTANAEVEAAQSKLASVAKTRREFSIPTISTLKRAIHDASRIEEDRSRNDRRRRLLATDTSGQKGSSSIDVDVDNSQPLDSPFQTVEGDSNDTPEVASAEGCILMLSIGMDDITPITLYGNPPLPTDSDASSHLEAVPIPSGDTALNIGHQEGIEPSAADENEILRDFHASMVSSTSNHPLVSSDLTPRHPAVMEWPDQTAPLPHEKRGGNQKKWKASVFPSSTFINQDRNMITGYTEGLEPSEASKSDTSMSALHPGTSSASLDIPKDPEINNSDPDVHSSLRNEENNKEKHPETDYLDILGKAIDDLAMAYQNAAVPGKAPPNPRSKKEDGENLKSAFHRTVEIDKSPIETVSNFELNTPTRASRTKTPPPGPRFPVPSSLGRPLQIDTRFDIGKPVVPYFDGFSPYPMVDLLRSNASPVRFEIPDLSSAPMRGRPIFTESSSELAIASPEYQASSNDSESRSRVTSPLSPPTTTEAPSRIPTHKTAVLHDSYEEIKAQVIPNEPPEMAPKKESLSSTMDGFKVPTSSTLTGFTSISSSDVRKRVIKRVEELVFTNAGDEQDALIFLAKYRNILEQGLPTSTYSTNAAFVDMDDAFNATKNAEKMFQGSAKWFSGSCTNADNWEQFVKEFRNAFAERITDAKIGKDVASFKWNFDAADAPKKAWARLRDMNSVLPKSKRIREEDLRRSFILSCTDLDWSNTAQNETFDGKTWEDYDLDMSDLLRGMASKVRFHPGSDHSS